MSTHKQPQLPQINNDSWRWAGYKLLNTLDRNNTSKKSNFNWVIVKK